MKSKKNLENLEQSTVTEEYPVDIKRKRAKGYFGDLGEVIESEVRRREE